MILMIVLEIVARYLFKNPTLWVHETSGFIFGMLIMLGIAYTHLHRGHVNVDLLYTRFPTRTRAIVDLFISACLFLFCGVMVWKGVQFALLSWVRWEHSHTAWAPALYPIKSIIPLGFLLLALQEVAYFIRSINTLRQGGERA